MHGGDSASAPPIEQPQAPRSSEAFIIPSGYGDHRLVLLVKDPWWLYAYWEVQPQRERQLRSQLKPEELSGLQTVLRVYDVTDRVFPQQAAHTWFDIALSGLATNWYIHVNAPNRSFVADIGLLTTGGRFLTLVRSNRVTTPRFGPSDAIDEAWVTTDEAYWKLFGVSAGIGMGSSPSGLHELLQRRHFSPGIIPGGVYSPVKTQRPEGFRLAVETELIVHGATDPKAAVTVQGQMVPVRPDGTFTVRLSLPDGEHVVPVQATSSDRQSRRTITPRIARQTETDATAAREADAASRVSGNQQVA